MQERLRVLREQTSQFDAPFGGMHHSRMSSRWSLDGGGSALLPAHEAALGLGGHYLAHSLQLRDLSSATKIPGTACGDVPCFSRSGDVVCIVAPFSFSFVFARWFVTVDLYPEDRLISGRLRKEDEKKMREERAKLDHHEKYG